VTVLRLGQVVESYVTGRRYLVTDRLGRGGFAEAYRAYRVDRLERRLGEDVCVKATFDERSWHREAYFGELLAANPRVIAVHDTFPKPVGSGPTRRMLYCLVMELAESGSLATYIAKNRRPWPEARIRREMIAVVTVLVQLHGAGAMHRDLTPFNVFVCRPGILKLGDFGIARHAANGVSLAADQFNGWFASTGLWQGDYRRWLQADDVWQIGQLLGVLVRGDAGTTLAPRQVRGLDCSPAMKELIARAIGPRSRRYADAFELVEALEKLPRPRPRRSVA